MPECVSVSEFVQEVQEDWSSPTTSSFTSKMINCRNTIYLLEEVSAEREWRGEDFQDPRTFIFFRKNVSA
uniref:Arf-GAP domain-containing protein n=1 Tax=Poecilia mexicana TaxID=48701 RepID=A0A3B3YRJ7_9TELE